MRLRLYDYLYWIVIMLWFAANLAWLITAKHVRFDRITLLIWVLVAYSLWRRWDQRPAPNNETGEGD